MGVSVPTAHTKWGLHSHCSHRHVCTAVPRLQGSIPGWRDLSSFDSSKRHMQARYKVNDDQEALQKECPAAALRVPPADVQVLQRASTAWHKLCTRTGPPPPPPQVASQHPRPAPKGVVSAEYDVVVLGGTLGILLATALLAQHNTTPSSSSGSSKDARQQQCQQQQRVALRVAVVERGVLLGRDQEWNCSLADIQVLVELGVLSLADVAEVVVTHIPCVRLGVAGAAELRLTGVMDAGVSPRRLLDVVKRRFLELGGVLLEHTAFTALHVFDDTAHLHLTPQQQQQQQQPRGDTRASSSSSSSAAEAAGGAGGRQAAFEPSPVTLSAPSSSSSGTTTTSAASAKAAATAAPSAGSLVVSACVVVDALGSFSPLSAQARGAAAPEAAMLLVGSCVETPAAAGAAASGSATAGGMSGAAAGADVLWGRSPIDTSSCQQFWWERFPAAGGSATTTYMFTFTDPAPDNSQLLETMAGLYGQQLGDYLGFPPESLSVQRVLCGFVPCYNGRVLPTVDRLLPVGDSAANRSALSLAGFCALLRHLPRLTAGLGEALEVGATTKQELSLLQPWCPGVTATTAMQRTMSVYSNQFTALREEAAAAAAAAGTAAAAPAAAAAAGTPAESGGTGFSAPATAAPTAGAEAGAAGAVPACADEGTAHTHAGPSSGCVLHGAVLGIMGASLQAMWDAVGEEGMRPFVADRIQLGPLGASMATQLSRDAAQLVSYSTFLGDTMGAARLLTGLGGLWLYGLLHSATPLTTPLHEALLAASPRLLYRWHRYTDAWLYGSGNDWQPPPPQQPQPPPQQQSQLPPPLPQQQQK